jgi:hypothetical protein
MAENAVARRGASIALACRAFGVSETCYRWDLENPNVWTETYHVPTWVEYVRHQERRTQADAESYERVLKLHRGKDRPKVHRMIERQAISLQDDTPLKNEPAKTSE